MEDNKLKSFFSGMIGGFVGTLAGHPIDTLRVKYQESNSKKNLINFTKDLIKKEGNKTLYRGIYSPFFGIGLEKCLVFGTRDIITKFQVFDNNTINSMVAGACSGLVCSTVVTPVERIKILNQTNVTFSQIKPKLNFKYLYHGTSSTLMREVPGYAIYFSTYDYLNRKYGSDNIFLTPFYGAAAGFVSWSIIYPSDPIKTKMQSNNNMSFKKAINTIMKDYGIKGFYRGASLGLLRAVVLHSFVFLGYEMTIKYI